MGPAEPGATVSVLLPRELLRISPGFYLALGDAAFAGDSAIVRFYWNVRSEGASALVAMLTTALNQQGLGFQLKVLNDPGRVFAL